MRLFTDLRRVAAVVVISCQCFAWRWHVQFLCFAHWKFTTDNLFLKPEPQMHRWFANEVLTHLSLFPLVKLLFSFFRETKKDEIRANNLWVWNHRKSGKVSIMAFSVELDRVARLLFCPKHLLACCKNFGRLSCTHYFAIRTKNGKHFPNCK